MKELTCLLICVLLIYIYINYVRKSLYLSRVKSDVDGNKYYVRNLKDKQEASDKLANLSQSLLQLINSIQSNKKEGVDRLVKRFDPTDIPPAE